jgi:hypothetical protein
MKRKKTITAADDDVKVRVIVEVTSKKHGLTRDETNILISRIVDESMLTIKNAPYIYAPISGMQIA